MRIDLSLQKVSSGIEKLWALVTAKPLSDLSSRTLHVPSLLTTQALNRLHQVALLDVDS